jgi:hypothetical protein
MRWIQRAISFLAAGTLLAQSPDIAKLLQRVDQLEQDNRRLKQDLDAVRKELVTLQQAADKVDVQAARIEELQQTKVEAAQKFPVKLSGLVLMNTFLYAGRTGGEDLPMVARLTPAVTNAGGTFRNTQIAIEYSGPHSILGGEFSGRLQMDFFGGTLNTQNQLVRLRTSNVSLNWANRSLTFAIDKPIFNPREPDSLAQLGVSPLANAGNLWLWQPQVRYEERVHLTTSTELRMRVGVYQTNETLAVPPASTSVSRSRPAAQGRVELSHERFAIATGFHRSESLVGGRSLDSWAWSADWLVPLGSRVDWTGFAFTGENLAVLGIAGLRQPFGLHTRGGWTQGTVRFSDRVKLHLLAGLDNDRHSTRNLAYGANLHIRLAPNVVFGPEIMQIRTTYPLFGVRLINRYDLALGYLF